MKKHLNKKEMGIYRDRLLNLRRRLRGDVNAMADVALQKTRSDAGGDLSSMPIHMADIGTDAYEQEFTLTMMQTEEGALEQIEAALERIAEGVYGICDECEGKIPKSRLNALLFTPYCVQCAEEIQTLG